ncbi:MAG TPA: NAD(P)/FAD-dependent oxidoreductase [Polyangiaceae bacterium]|nr:NAD(P)/FAD-dependent oxidoreductase [Polyangiaceae bacterium]
MAGQTEHYDVVIVGGGPAGLSSALMLGRCRRKTLVCDSGHYRNRAAQAMHGYLSRDGVEPAEFLNLARQEIERYPSVALWFGEVTDVIRAQGGFVVERQRAERVTARKLVLATGVIDELPELEGAAELMGRGVFHCPYCDGWELADQPLAAYGRQDVRGAGLSLLLTSWSRDVVLLCDGPAELEAELRARLLRAGVVIDERRVASLQAEDGRLAWISFDDGSRLARRGLFFNTGRHQGSDFAARLGCEEAEVRGCVVGRSGKTSIPGLFVAGDASRDVLQVVVAAAEGAEAAIEIHCELLRDDGVLPPSDD